MQVNEIKNGVIARQGGCVVATHAVTEVLLAEVGTAPQLVTVTFAEDVSRELLSLIDTSAVGSYLESSELISTNGCETYWASVLNSCCATDDFVLPSGEKAYRWRIAITISSWGAESDRLLELGLASCVAALQRLVVPTLRWNEEKQWWAETTESVMDETRVWAQSKPFLHSIPRAVALFQGGDGVWAVEGSAKRATGLLVVTAIFAPNNVARRYLIRLTGGALAAPELEELVKHAAERLADPTATVFQQIKT